MALTGNHTFQVPNLKSIMLNLAFLLVLRHMYSMGNYNTYVGMFKAVRLCVKAQRLRKLQKFGIDYSWNRYGSTHSKTITVDGTARQKRILLCVISCVCVCVGCVSLCVCFVCDFPLPSSCRFPLSCRPSGRVALDLSYSH
mgnify:CR=1 FL=1